MPRGRPPDPNLCLSPSSASHCFHGLFSMEALLLGFEEVQELRKAWTTCALPPSLTPLLPPTDCSPSSEQHRQSSAAMFYDHDLSFTLPAPSSSTAGNAPLDPLRPPVHHEVVLDAVALNAEGLDFVGGLDISFREDGSGDEGIATLAVLSWPDLKVRLRPRILKQRP